MRSTQKKTIGDMPILTPAACESLSRKILAMRTPTKSMLWFAIASHLIFCVAAAVLLSCCAVLCAVVHRCAS